MKITYESEFTRLEFEPSESLQFQLWKTTEDLTDELLKAEVSANASNVVANNAKLLLTDTRNFDYTVSVKMQEWMLANFFGPIIRCGCKKYAIVMPSDIFSQVSVEQAVEENKDESIQTRYFDTIESARAWLLSV